MALVRPHPLQVQNEPPQFVGADFVDAGGEAAGAKEVDKGENQSDPYLYGSSALALGAGAPCVALQEVPQLGVGAARFGGGGNRAVNLAAIVTPFCRSSGSFDPFSPGGRDFSQL